jgi:hypothetical protein
MSVVEVKRALRRLLWWLITRLLLSSRDHAYQATAARLANKSLDLGTVCRFGRNFALASVRHHL